MRNDIGQSIKNQAATVSLDVDKMLYERLQNAQTWRHLEVTQDMRVNDVDKRLSHFLTDLTSGYQGMYQELMCVDNKGKVIASSNSAHLGAFEFIGPDRTAPNFAQNNTVPSVYPGALQLKSAYSNPVLPVVAPIPSLFGGGQLGKLYLMFDWTEIYRILDQAAKNGESLLLLDSDGKIIAASADLRQQGVLLHKIPPAWLEHTENGIGLHDGTIFHKRQVMVGFKRSTGFQQFPGFHWVTLVIESSNHAFIPVNKIALVFVSLLLLTSTLAFVFSMWVADRIARPIARLTEFTRQFNRTKTLPAPLPVASGEVGELLRVFVNMVQDLNQSRADLIQASKLAVLGELAAVMAHEIRTPIGILRSSAQILAREPHLSQEAQELTGFIQSETERLNRLVSTLLDSARVRAPLLQPNDLNFIVQNCIELLTPQAIKKQIAITASLSEQAAWAEVDADQLTQVLLNLVLNAIQILPEHGLINVTVRQGADQWLIDIADNGPGIPAEEVQRVFDPFFTKREGGVGLGLAVVKQVIMAHQGKIEVGKSTLGGALFAITLPARHIHRAFSQGISEQGT